MSEELARVTRAVEARGAVEREYRSAVLAAVRSDGVPAVSRAAGVSRQAVRQLVLRAGSDNGRLRERLAELDGRWQSLVEWRAGAYTLKDASAITAYRNGRAGKRRKRGLGPLPTVRSEALALAESELLGFLRDGSSVDGVDLEAVRAEVLEAEALRDRLEAVSDDIPF